MKQFILLTLLLLISGNSAAQQLLSGVVLDERNIPIPHAKVFVKNSADLRTLADVNGYYEFRLFPGEYFMVFSATGYDDRESYITINEVPVKRDIQLFPSKIQDLAEKVQPWA